MTPDVVGVAVVAASLAAGGGALYLLQYLYSQRKKSGAAWFMGNISAVAVFCVAYGIALLVSEPTVRIALEAVAFVCVAFMGPFFLAFGLDYTGRGGLIQTPLFGVVAVVPLTTAVLTATNQTHGLIWRGLEFEPVFGLATVMYTIQPLGVFALLFSILTAGVGSLLLIGAVLSYGPLYRREAIAVTLSTLPPTVGVLLWLFEIGPVPQLHLTAPLMVIHIVLDGYAFIGTHMFDTNPATQRMAERAGLDSLSDPVFVLDPTDQIVRVNDRADAVFVDDASLPVMPEAVFGASLSSLRETGEITVDSAHSRTFAVSYTSLTDSRERQVGSMIVLYDVTEERQREQQLSVLNRVLRHNLRNETTVISGYADILATTIEEPEQSKQATTIREASNRLLSIAENAKTFETIQNREPQPEPLAVADILADIEATCAETNTGTVSWTTPNACEILTDQAMLTLAVQQLVENGLIHADTEEPTVEITVSEPADEPEAVAIEIRDSNSPIPEIETDSLRTAKETPLQHGQGIGLWIAYWCVQKLRGEIRFEYADGNIVTVTIPALTPRAERQTTV